MFQVIMRDGDASILCNVVFADAVGHLYQPIEYFTLLEIENRLAFKRRHDAIAQIVPPVVKVGHIAHTGLLMELFIRWKLC